MLRIPFYKPSIGAEEIAEVSCVCGSIKDIVVLNRRVVAFFDDKPRTWHKQPHDIPVVGMRNAF